MEHFEFTVAKGAAWLELGIEVIGVLVISLGCVFAAVDVLRMVLKREQASYIGVRLKLGRSLGLGLEFQLAADILATAFTPSFEQIGQLAAIAAIRTALNFFLNLEIKEEEKQGLPEPELAASRAPVMAASVTY